MSNNQRMALASLVLSACLQGCATTPTVMDKADPVAISSTDPRYSGYLRRVHELIRTKMSYPCVKDEATSRCDYKPARLTIEFSLLQDGQIDYVRVAQKAEWEVFDEYSVSAIRRAAPFPPVPPALMAQAKPGSAGVRILVSFEYRIVDPNLPR